MSSYGRNFDFRIPPTDGERGSRYVLDPTGDATVTIGAPVIVKDGSNDGSGRLIVELADGNQAKPKPGQGGIMVFEHAPAAFAGYDPMVTLHSDLGTAKAGAAVQVISGEGRVKVVFRNTTDSTFLHVREYDGVKMVDETLGGGTPTIAVGNYLTPKASPSATAGYWEVTGSAANGWLVVESVDSVRGEVEARLNF